MPARLTEKGQNPIDEDPLPGASRFYIYDPFGNRIEFLEWFALLNFEHYIYFCTQGSIADADTIA